MPGGRGRVRKGYVIAGALCVALLAALVVVLNERGAKVPTGQPPASTAVRGSHQWFFVDMGNDIASATYRDMVMRALLTIQAKDRPLWTRMRTTTGRWDITACRDCLGRGAGVTTTGNLDWCRTSLNLPVAARYAMLEGVGPDWLAGLLVGAWARCAPGTYSSTWPPTFI
jgi:hypothetical protein